MALKVGSDAADLCLQQEILLAMRARGITQRELSRSLGVTEGGLSRFFRSRRDIRASALLKILRAVGLSPEKELADRRLARTPAQARGLSDTAARIGQLVDGLPPEERRVLFRYIVQYHQAFTGAGRERGA
jgi:transcriptional regulator with XRE-family HTH domain